MAKAKTKEQTLVRPTQLAEELGVDAKRIRAFLRSEFTRPTEAKNSSWMVDEKQAQAVRAKFSKTSKDED